MVAMDGPLDPAAARQVRGMTGTLAHRGPDGDGYHVDLFAALGHRRLAIIDRAGGDQPMANEDGSCWIVFNGEVYNHRELRRELEGRGHAFRTHCDTEAIIHAYEEWGTDCVARLEGMFAFAIYDKRDRTVLLARDRLGKKPLFFFVRGGVLHFASELKALRASPLWEGDLNTDAFEEYLQLGYILAPETAYRNVFKLEPGHWLRTKNGRLEQRAYWDITEFDTDRRAEAVVLDELDAQLRRAVRVRLESEVPLGAFLSGGIDSGLVVSYMREFCDDVDTTSVGFEDPQHNEVSAARLTAQHLRTTQHAEVVHPRLEHVMGPIVAAFDEPFADSSSIPTYYVSAAARRHVTVALSGDGGDEGFAGYDFRYVPHAIEAFARTAVPGRPTRAALGSLGRRWPRSARLPRILRLGTLLQNVGRDPAAAYYADLCFLKPPRARQLLGLPPVRDEDTRAYAGVTDAYRRCPSTSAVQRAQYADLKIYLPNDVLTKVDRMSMQHSLEIRCPLLDHRVLEFAFKLPTATKMPRLSAKHLLRKLAVRRLPAGLSSLPKKGFTAPVGRWIAGRYAGEFADEVLGGDSRTAAVFDRDLLRTYFSEHRHGTADHSYVLWAVWVMERWLRQTAMSRTADLAAAAPHS
jgi:asparagine synthase (glutamine-hydrolysing)